MATAYHQAETSDDPELVDGNAKTDVDIELGDTVPPTYSNESNEFNDATSLLTDAELLKRLPDKDASNADVTSYSSCSRRGARATASCLTICRWMRRTLPGTSTSAT